MSASATVPAADVQGDLRRYPLPRLLFYLYKKGFMGRLEVERPEGGKATVYFRDGMAVHAEMPSLDDVLGRVLLQRGWISPEHYEQSLQLYQPGKVLHGQVLLQIGAIDQPKLIAGLNLQLRRKVNRLFFYRQAPFDLFHDGHARGVEGEAAHVRADPLAVIYNGVRNALDGAQLAPQLEKLNGSQVRLRSDCEAVLPRYGASQAENNLALTLMRGAVAVHQIPQISNLSTVETQMLLYVLWVTEALIVTQAPVQATASHAAPSTGSASPPPSQGRAQTPPPRVHSTSTGTVKLDAEVFETAARIAVTDSSGSSGSGTRHPVVKDENAAKAMRQTIEEIGGKMADLDHFQLLQLDRKATLDQVRDAYFRLAKQFHPDRVAGLGLIDLGRPAEEIFRRVAEAHTVLTDPKRRAAYEQEIDRPTEEDNETRNAVEAEFSFQKGMVSFRKKQYDGAVGHFKDAYRLNNKEGEHLAWIAWTRFCDPRSKKKEILPELKAQLLEALELSGRSAACHYFLGEIFLALEEERRAVISFERALQAKPDHIEAQRRLRLIRMNREKAQAREKKGLFGLGRKKG